MADWIEEYKRFPETKDYHLKQLNRLEAGESIDFIMHTQRLAIIWMGIAILHNKRRAASLLLDYCNVPENGLSLKERIALLQLGVTDDKV